ncbi:hypothetical protein SASPL_119715 [Salvia splendens]|uniref:Calmodulin n=1 Tax=Salvia splendens TaxID=180675 RepID=A0A8X8XRK0_SALSN|nr:hypothetical protein SASPL_119715 [Salvia splendens]
MDERRHGGRRGGGCGDLPNEETARQRDLRDIENDDLRQQGKSNPTRSIAPERRSMDDPLFSNVLTSYDADEPSKNSNSTIFLMPVYDTPVYDEDIFYELPEPPKNSNNNILSMPVYDKPVCDEDILSMPVYDKPVYDEDIFYELPGLMSKSSPPSVKFDDAAEDEGVAVNDNEELEEIVVMRRERKRGWNGLSRVSLADVSIKSQKKDWEKYWVLEKKKKEEPCELDPCFMQLTDTFMEIQEIAETTKHNEVNSALHGLRKYPPPFVKFDDAAKDEGVSVEVSVEDDKEYDEAEGGNRLLGFVFGYNGGVGDLQGEKTELLEKKLYIGDAMSGDIFSITLIRKLPFPWTTCSPHREFRKYMDDKELELYAIFQAIDVEHNSCIVTEELWDALVKVGIELDAKELASFVEHVDEDNNGVKEWTDFLLLYPHEATIENIWERVLVNML